MDVLSVRIVMQRLYDTEKNKQYRKRQAENIANMNRSLHRKIIFDRY